MADSCDPKQVHDPLSLKFVDTEQSNLDSISTAEFEHLTLAVVGEIELISEQSHLREIKIFDVNWIALKKASPVLSGLFERGQPIIRMEECEVQAFRDLLHFVDDEHLLDVSEFTLNRLFDLQKVGDKFAVMDCLKFCNTELARLPITCKLAEFYLDPPCSFSSELISSSKMKLAEECFVRTYRDINRHWEDILYLSPPLFKVLIMDNNLEVDHETTILELCSQWASAEEGRIGFLQENVVNFVRWHYLSIEQLYEAKRISKAEGGSDEVGRDMSFLMAKQVSAEIDRAVKYHTDSAKYNQSVFIDWDTKYSKDPAPVIKFFLWKDNSPRDVERDYEQWPIRVNVGVYSEYSIYFELNRNHLRKLLLGQRVDSQVFCCFKTNSRFRLFFDRVNIGSKEYLGFYLRALENEDPKMDFTCKFYVFSKKAAKNEVKKDGYVLKHRETFRSGCAGSHNLLGPSLMELMEDSNYFLNDKIFFRVILDTPILKEELDDIIKRLLDSKKIKAVEIHKLCADAENILLDQPSLLQLKAPIKICGDIRGEYTDLLRIFKVGGYPTSTDYLFLGGYVNHSIETICLLLAYKIRYKDSFFLLRGSQECASMCQECGFDKECKRRFNNRIWETFVQCFNCLPVAALVGSKILCMHGGLSQELENLNQINKIVRPAEVPGQGLLYDLLWADPDGDAQGWGKNNEGATTFGADRVNEFLLKHGLDLICRAHQVVDDGYEYLVKKKLLTIFSAPNYLGKFDNNGAILSVDGSLKHSFQVLQVSKNQKQGSTINTKKPATRKGEEE